MKKKRLNEDEVGAMLEETFGGEPFERIEPPPRFNLFFSGGSAAESFLDNLKRFLILPSRPRRLAFSAAVVALLLLVLIPLIPNEARVTYRAADVAESVGLPTGRLTGAPGALHWPAAEGAVTYRVELTDPEGALLWEGDAGDNHVDLPSSLFAGAPVGSEYRVLVTGYGPDGEEMGQQSSRFVVLP